jgi:hypothetical protein
MRQLYTIKLNEKEIVMKKGKLFKNSQVSRLMSVLLFTVVIGVGITMGNNYAFSGEIETWSTPKPYSNRLDINSGSRLSIGGSQSLEVTVNGITERNYDFIYIYDRNGRQIRKFHGQINESFSVKGSFIKACFTSDYSVTKSGVTVTVSNEPSKPPEFLTENLSSNRWNRLAIGRLQVVTFYDGRESYPQLQIGYNKPSGGTGWISINNIHNFSIKYETREYALNNATINGRFKISGVSPNGVIDGLAFGLYWKDNDGKYHMLKSKSKNPSSRSAFVGAWPIAISQAQFDNKIFQVTDGNAKAQARATLYGAEYLPNGEFTLDVY